MNTASIESSLYKYLYDSLEVPFGVKIFESTFYLNFENFTKWVAIDTLSNSAGAVPRALFFLHIAVKDTGVHDTQILNRLVDSVTNVVNYGTRIDIYDDNTGILAGEAEVSDTSLSPIVKHPTGGSYRSLTVGLVYAGSDPM